MSIASMPLSYRTFFAILQCQIFHTIQLWCGFETLLDRAENEPSVTFQAD